LLLTEDNGIGMNQEKQPDNGIYTMKFRSEQKSGFFSMSRINRMKPFWDTSYSYLV